MIKDSGARTEFSTGAKRDIQHGKASPDYTLPAFFKEDSK